MTDAAGLLDRETLEVLWFARQFLRRHGVPCRFLDWLPERLPPEPPWLPVWPEFYK